MPGETAGLLLLIPFFQTHNMNTEEVCNVCGGVTTFNWKAEENE
jgi:hypothetical protein